MHSLSHRRASIAALALLAASSFAGCGALSGGSVASSATPSDELREVKTITYVNPAPFYPAFDDVGRCFTEAAEKNGWTPVEVGTSGGSVDNQGAIDLISQAIANGTDALVVFPTIPELFTPIIQQARDAGIYVVAQNAGAPSTGQQTQVGTDAKELGALIAEGLGAIDPAAQVGILSGTASTTPHVQEIEGFTEYAAEHFPDMKVIASDYTNGDSTKGPEVFSNMLTAHPEITVLFPIEGTSVAAAIAAINERGASDTIRVVANDLTADHRAAIEDGSLLGVGEQGWCESGTEAVNAVKQLSEGKTLPEFIPTTSTWYDLANLPN